MKTIQYRIALGVIAFGLTFWFGCANDMLNEPSAASGEPAPARVVATISVLGEIAKAIGGDSVEVATLIGPGPSPHHYSARPTDRERLSKAELVLLIGDGLDDWAGEAAAPGATLKFAQIVGSHGACPYCEQTHSQSAADTSSPNSEDLKLYPAVADHHFWLDPMWTRDYAKHVCARLVKLRPDRRAEFESACDAFVARLAKIDSTWTELAAELNASQAKVVTHHAVFGNLALRYNLRLFALSNAHHGHGLTPKQSERAEAWFAENPRVLFVEEQLGDGAMERLVERLDLAVYPLEPLPRPADGYRSYLELMETNAETLRRALLN